MLLKNEPYVKINRNYTNLLDNSNNRSYAGQNEHWTSFTKLDKYLCLIDIFEFKDYGQIIIFVSILFA